MTTMMTMFVAGGGPLLCAEGDLDTQPALGPT